MADRNVLEQVLDAKLEPVLATINELKETFSGFLKSIEFISAQYDDLTRKVGKFESENKELRQETDRLKSEIFKLTNELRTEKNVSNDLEQYSRRDCLEIKGIPIQSEDDTDEIVQNLGSQIGVEISVNDISISHRLLVPRSSTNNITIRDPVIIVKFVRRNVRDKFYAGRKYLRGKSTQDLGFTRTTGNKVFISESLTQQNRALFNRCLEAKKRLNYRYIWTQMGKIFLRESTNDRAIHISNDRDLQRLENTSPPGQTPHQEEP